MPVEPLGYRFQFLANVVIGKPIKYAYLLSALLAHWHPRWLLCFLGFQPLEKTDRKNHRNFITKHVAFLFRFSALAFMDGN